MSTLFRELIGPGGSLQAARRACRLIASALGLEPLQQARISAAVSELLRAAVSVGPAEVELAVAADVLRVQVTGSARLVTDTASPYVAGVNAARRLMDSFDVSHRPDGRVDVIAGRALPSNARVDRALALARTLEVPQGTAAGDDRDELDAVYRDLSQAISQLDERQVELERVNRELEETNRGVVALYSELEEKAETLRRVSEIKSRFISNVSHEFRTPINSILSLSRLLMDEVDGPLNDEQTKQVKFVRKSAEALSELVNDLLDLAKIEAGKVDVRPTTFDVPELFAGLRGIMRPLLVNDQVALQFDEEGKSARLVTDEGKLSQILRNLISNALKFTDRGEVRVRAQVHDGLAHFSVADTGIGIAPEHLDRIFEEFVQVEGPHQRGVKGTGLGLPLSRRLAELLGGTLTVESEVGKGSVFHLRIPQVYGESPADASASAERSATLPELDERRQPLLVVEDDPQTLFIYEKYLKDSGYQVVPARSIPEARSLVRQFKPAAVVLDVLLDGDTSWGFLAELRSNPATQAVPVLVVTVIDHQLKARALGADEFCVKPIERNWLLSRLARLVRRRTSPKVLVVDDDDVARYVVRRALEDTPYELLEATGGREGLDKATAELPDIILLDLSMPDLSGFDVLDALKAQPSTRGIPVIIHSSRALDPAERERLSRSASAIIDKDDPSRAGALERIRTALMNAGVVPAPTASRRA